MAKIAKKFLNSIFYKEPRFLYHCVNCKEFTQYRLYWNSKIAELHRAKSNHMNNTNTVKYLWVCSEQCFKNYLFKELWALRIPVNLILAQGLIPEYKRKGHK